MQKQHFFTKLQNPKIILTLILGVFFFKGVFLVSAFPIFSGQDESRHYNTIQFLAEPTEKNWQMQKQEGKQNKDDISTYRYSDEIKGTSLATDTDVLRGDMFNNIAFSNSSIGVNENQINQRPWEPINHVSPPDMVFDTQFYHKIGALIEKTFANQSILVRFYLVRIFSVLMGMLVVFLAFQIAKNAGLGEKHSLLIAAIIAFQPKVTTYFTNINYDVLFIPMFVLFTFAGVLILKKGLDWKNVLLMIFSVAIALLTKKTGSVLLVAMILILGSQFWHKFKAASKNVQYAFYSLSVVFTALAAIYLDKYLPAKMTLQSVFDYLDKSCSIGRFALSSRTYWGTLDWTNNWFMGEVTNFIWLVQAFAFAGILLFFFGKKIQPKYLPEKKYVIFFIFMTVILQLGIRFADWTIFTQSGSLDLGTPGRYFLPNIAAHMILVFTGLGALFSHYKKEKWLDWSILTSLILMISLTVYLMFDAIIYRYYL